MAVADDGTVYVVNDVSPHLIVGRLSSFSGLEDTLLELTLSASSPSFLSALDDIIYSINVELEWRERRG